MAVLIANNATGRLAGSIDSIQTSVSLQAGEGSRFPSPSGTDWFPITFIQPDGNLEVMHCTARVNDLLTVTRAQEGTSAKTFAAGDRCALRVTAAAYDDLRTPRGCILQWSGAIVDIPTGWALCDGTSGTVNLADRFVVAAGAAYAVGDTGGADSVTLTTAQIPSHNHGGQTGSAGSHDHGGVTGYDGGHSHTASTGNAGYHNHTASTGSSGSHSHSGSTDTTGSHTHEVNRRTGGGSRTGAYSGGNDGGTFTSGSGGSHSHSLTINSNGSHTHSVTVNSDGTHNHGVTVDAVGTHRHTISSVASHLHTVASEGGGAAHENRPAFYALAFIQKI